MAAGIEPAPVIAGGRAGQDRHGLGDHDVIGLGATRKREQR